MRGFAPLSASVASACLEGSERPLIPSGGSPDTFSRKGRRDPKQALSHLSHLPNQGHPLHA